MNDYHSLAKRPPIRIQKILDAARDEQCTMYSPWCINDPTTTVACHSNMQLHGKAMKRKADDIFVFFGCHGCHNWYDKSDASHAEKDSYFWPAMSRTWRRLIELEILK